MKEEFRIEKKGFYLFVGILSIMLVLTFLGPMVSAAGYKIGYYTLARSVTKTGEPIGQPVFEVESGLGAVFLTIDDYIYSYVNFKEAVGPYTLKTEWYDPSGKLYASTELKEETSKTFNDYWAWSRILVAGKLDEENVGVWSVVTYFNNEPIIIAKFLLLTPDLVWFFTKGYGEMSEENEVLRGILTEYEDKLQLYEEKIKNLESNLSEANSKLAETSRELSRVSSERDGLKAEASSLQIKSQQLENQVNDLSFQRFILIAIAVSTSILTVAVLMIKRRQPTPPPPPMRN